MGDVSVYSSASRPEEFARAWPAKASCARCSGVMRSLQQWW